MEAVLSRNPGLDKPDDEVVKLKARGLKALLRQAFQKGREDAAEELARFNATKAGPSRGTGTSSVPSFFEEYFGNAFRGK
jgi:hypothetical protein